MKYYILKNASNANGWDMFPAGEAINYTLDSESLSVPHEIEIGSMVIGYRSAPKDRFYSLFKVVNVSDKTLLFEKELEVNGGISISEVRPEIRELMESDYSGIFEIEKPDYESICNSMFVYASTDFVGKPFIGTNEKKNIEESKSKSLQQIFYGAPGTGKSHFVKCDEKVKRADEKNLVFRTTFHPDSDYSTFVGAYKPTMKTVPNQYKAVVGKDEEITYSFIPQAFLQAYIAAWNNQEENVFLVIEEINRGNCAQIFGDLFQLLDRDDDGYSEYPIKADKDLAKYLINGKDEEGKEILTNKDGIKDSKLKLPNNLYIWATMNTSDQSLFPIDSAFKRRWDWRYIPIAQGRNEDGTEKRWEIEGQGENSWWTFIQGINEVIDVTTHSEDKKLGFFFCKAQDGVVKKETFVNKVVFYLWNDVFKVYGFKSEIFDKKGKDDKTKKITFKSFYNGDGSVNEETMSVFVKNVMAKASKESTDSENLDVSGDDDTQS